MYAVDASWIALSYAETGGGGSVFWRVDFVPRECVTATRAATSGGAGLIAGVRSRAASRPLKKTADIQRSEIRAVIFSLFVQYRHGDGGLHAAMGFAVLIGLNGGVLCQFLQDQCRVVF